MRSLHGIHKNYTAHLIQVLVIVKLNTAQVTKFAKITETYYLQTSKINEFTIFVVRSKLRAQPNSLHSSLLASLGVVRPSTMATSSDFSSPGSTKEALSKKLDSQLTCAVCLERYTDPRTLPCAHSYCKDCINRLPVELDNGRQVVKCPSCRQPTHLGDKGASSFPVAFLINNLLEMDELLEKPVDSVPMCQAHNDKQDIYCDTCEEHICFKCSTEYHRDHQCDRAERLFTRHKQQIEACLQPMREQIVELEQTLARFDTREREIREQGEAVQREIDQTYQQTINRLQETRRKASQEAATVLQEKLELHSLQKANAEALLVQLKSCREFIEEELRSQSQYQIQAAKKQLVQHIKDTHSEVKVSELQPAQETNTTFTADKNTLSACSHIGDISSRHSFLCPGLFSIDLPSYFVLNGKVEVLLTAPISFSASRLCCQLTPAQSSDARPVVCPVTGVGRGQFWVMIQPSTTGLHQLRVLVDGVDIYGSPFNAFNVGVVREDNLVTFAKGFEWPYGIAVTDDGKHVIVTDNYAHCVTVHSNTGEVVSRFGSHGFEPGKFEYPSSVAISADKHIFVVDGFFGTRVQKFTFSSSYEAVYDAHVTKVAIHSTSGKVLCTNRTKCSVTVLNADLTFSHSFGDEKFTNPNGIAIDTKGMVYVTDNKRGVVLKFTLDGKHLATIGSKGEQPHQFRFPGFICIDSNDIMYVTDNNKFKVMMFTTEGRFLGSFVHKFESCLFYPRGLAADKSGNIYVCDRGTRQVLVSRPFY